jgi:RNA polymerase sigma-70 factor (ECF subfamily)
MKDKEDREELEREIRKHFDAGDKERAATVLLKGYGREVLGFLIARLRDRDAAADVFSLFTEDLWKGFDGFRWDCSARVWSYALARHAASRYIGDAQKRRKRYVALSRAGPLSAIEQKIRTATLRAARTEARSGIERLRESLPVEEQTLIMLRVNRKLDWKEIALIMTGDAAGSPDATLEKEAVRLRKRYQLVKDKLRRMALEQGLISASGD